MNTGFSTSGPGRYAINIKTGERRLLADGEVIADGEGYITPFLLMDAAKNDAPVTSETLAAGSKILGEGFNRAAYAVLTDAAARRKMVETRLAVADHGKPVEFIDAAFRILVTDEAPRANALRPKFAELVLNDAQRAVAEDGIRRALAANAKLQTGGAIRDAAADGAREARSKILSELWKSPERREEEAKLAGLTYEQRMAARFNATHPAGGYVPREKQ